MPKDALSLTGATSQSLPDDFVNYHSPGQVRPDFECSSIDGLNETSTGPYCVGDIFEVTMQFSGEESSFSSLRGHNGNYKIITTTNCTYLSGQHAGSVIRFEADAAGTATVGVAYADGYNEHATNYDTELQHSVTISTYDVTCDNWEMGDCDADGNLDDVRIYYTISCGSPNYDITLERKPSGTADSNYQQVNTDTVSSDGQHTICDLDAPTDQDYEYRVTVQDANLNSVSCTILVAHFQ